MTHGIEARRVSENMWVVQKKMACINGLDAWFVIATCYEPSAEEIGYSDGAIMDAETWARTIASALATPTAGIPDTTQDGRG